MDFSEFTSFTALTKMNKKMKKSPNSIFIPLSFLFLFIFLSCNQDPDAPVDDTPTSGKIRISVDETISPMIESQVETFQSIYKYARITASYRNEKDAIIEFLNDSSRLVIIGRDLTNDEKKILEQLQIIPKKTKIAFDGICLVQNKSSKDTLIMLENLNNLLAGKIQRWNELVPTSSKTREVQLVFDNSSSGLYRHIAEQAGLKKIENKNVYAVNGSKEVINYIVNNPNAIEFLGLSWLSDGDDSTTNVLLKSVPVCEIAPREISQFAGY